MFDKINLISFLYNNIAYSKTIVYQRMERVINNKVCFRTKRNINNITLITITKLCPIISFLLLSLVNSTNILFDYSNIN